MESISEVISKILKERKVQGNSVELAKSSLQNPKVKNFLTTHQAEISKDMIAASLTNLYIYAQQVESANDKIVADYQPQLFINGGIIDITYVPTKAKALASQEKQTAKKIELIDLPAKLRQVKLADVEQTPERKLALLEIASFLKSFEQDPHTRGLYLEGDFGVGKTFLLAGLANTIASRGYQVSFLHVPSFIAGLSSHFSDNSLNQEVDRLANVPVLILDDIGAETLSEWSRDDILGVILQKRMDNVLPTFFSSNMDMKQLEEHFAETRNNLDEVKAKRLMERVRFLSKEVFVDGANRRNPS
ncbi:primosomal protein DnaI [Lactobacillus rodentium]|uniref:Primosomal protein DnaI n=1 Tax=Lactobacillus rodentium TaxID=947835 RepID=A0A2Z6T7B1_9LACO|nr:primosomal protein DnaI [Lactobacillus rodentium]MCR1894215.1 primosomal protein DnaI [Lactobacillus rodentium]GBG04511.1 primosomal protein DnaI [Lactobacillus rodentium]